MSIEGEAAGDVLTGAVIAHTVEGRKTGSDGAHGAEEHALCRNCGAQLQGAYCSNCGQSAHIHRTLTSIGHDILHGVFHFEGKVWKTFPELFFHPGRLTRRYIDGERAKFVSPMALYLFTVFLMFAVIGSIGGGHSGQNNTNINFVTPDSKEAKDELAASLSEMDQEIASTRAKLAKPGLDADERADLEDDLTSIQSSRDAVAAVASGDLSKLTSAGRASAAKKQQGAEAKAATDEDGQIVSPNTNINTGWSALDDRLRAGVQEIKENPRLLIYKLKTYGYKYSWALIPMSLPFLWLLFFWRRDVHLYDHAIFVTYSISFIMLLLVLLSILGALHVSSTILGLSTLLVPIHMYKQLRGAYSLSRFGAFMRLIFLLISASIVLVLFTALLVLLGLTG
ncbi:MAG: DUF3667 domain-containing protein [Povalibacter sp.]